MKAELSVEENCEAEIDALPAAALQEVLHRLEFLRENPRGAQTAGIRGAPEVRRAVTGKYLNLLFSRRERGHRLYADGSAWSQKTADAQKLVSKIKDTQG